jgi:hypothetical protein
MVVECHTSPLTYGIFMTLTKLGTVPTSLLRHTSSVLRTSAWVSTLVGVAVRHTTNSHAATPDSSRARKLQRNGGREAVGREPQNTGRGAQAASPTSGTTIFTHEGATVRGANLNAVMKPNAVGNAPVILLKESRSCLSKITAIAAHHCHMPHCHRDVRVCGHSRNDGSTASAHRSPVIADKESGRVPYSPQLSSFSVL